MTREYTDPTFEHPDIPVMVAPCVPNEVGAPLGTVQLMVALPSLIVNVVELVLIYLPPTLTRRPMLLRPYPLVTPSCPLPEEGLYCQLVPPTALQTIASGATVPAEAKETEVGVM